MLVTKLQMDVDEDAAALENKETAVQEYSDENYKNFTDLVETNPVMENDHDEFSQDYADSNPIPTDNQKEDKTSLKFHF